MVSIHIKHESGKKVNLPTIKRTLTSTLIFRIREILSCYNRECILFHLPPYIKFLLSLCRLFQIPHDERKMYKFFFWKFHKNTLHRKGPFLLKYFFLVSFSNNHFCLKTIFLIHKKHTSPFMSSAQTFHFRRILKTLLLNIFIFITM